MSTAPPPWDVPTVASYITQDRLRSYITASNGDLDAALRLYDWNITASSSVLGLVSMVEVAVRNAMDQSLTRWSDHKNAGASWFDLVPLDTRGRSDLTLARQRATRGQRSEIHGKVVAELMFGFWRYLVAPRYLTSLWVPELHTAFPDGHPDLATRRQQVHGHLERINFVRNRAAHHEPIHRRDLTRDVSSALALVGWISPDLRLWVAANETVSLSYSTRPV